TTRPAWTKPATALNRPGMPRGPGASRPRSRPTWRASAGWSARSWFASWSPWTGTAARGTAGRSGPQTTRASAPPPGPGGAPSPPGRGAAGCVGPAGAAPNLPGLQFLEVLGSGGMGVVWKARQAALGRDVAVKLLRDAHLATAEQRERFQQEARALARLRHPHLIQVHEFGDLPSAHGTTGQPYLVLEYVSGGSLADHLRGAPQPPAAAARLVETLARAIQHAHEQGIIHRDLKPANVLLVSGGVVSGEWSDTTTHHSQLTTHQPKITDFG